jgi:hypothetical protein
MELSNRETIERIGQVQVAVLSAASPVTLAAAGAALPIDAWLRPRG